ncbi:unnamed protein product [Caenorhabditis angaria]|uniref:Uncharacterized protein n=1 Tax=Caenorhabditis angaria TaxID=860376 RepID=A0A9P1IGQ0_9PELO|nr:unnamed protein product [Caenorhabditis angaria]
MNKQKSSMKKGPQTAKGDEANKRVKFAVPVTSRIGTPPAPKNSGEKRAAGNAETAAKPQKKSKTSESTDCFQLASEQKKIEEDLSETESNIFSTITDVRIIANKMIGGIQTVSSASSKLKASEDFLLKSPDLVESIKIKSNEFAEKSKTKCDYIEKSIAAKSNYNNIISNLDTYLETVKIPEDILEYEVDFEKVREIFNNLVNIIEIM